ncbi:MAG: AhpC/TSA family protein [Microbacteriaceae bacterium]|nr:AhpC/TSA family protein [Microbacteriaceae bacterium]
MNNLTIASQVDSFNSGFNAQIGAELAEVFAGEQRDLIASGLPASVVAVGDTVTDAPLLDADGVATSLAAVIENGPAVIVFYRGAWCPYCNLTLKTYQRELLPLLSAQSVALIAISPQTPDGSAAAVQNGELGFPVLSDPKNHLIGELGIRTEPSAEARAAHTALGFDVADSNADSTGDIPFPTVLVIDANRVVTFADVHVDYTTRTEVADILAAVAAL